MAWVERKYVKAFPQISSTGEDGFNLEGVISNHYSVAIFGFLTLLFVVIVSELFGGLAALLNFHCWSVKFSSFQKPLSHLLVKSKWQYQSGLGLQKNSRGTSN